MCLFSLKEIVYDINDKVLNLLDSDNKIALPENIYPNRKNGMGYELGYKVNYDYIIVDSPPVQPVSDTLILTQASDYNLFVLRSNETRTASFMSSIKKIQNVDAKINGIIINDLDTSKDSYYSYYYNYSSEYYTKS